MSIGKHKQFWLDPGWSGFNKLTDDQKLKLYELGYELSKTPLAEREEEKRYWLKLKTTLPLSEKFRYLVLYKPEGEYIILNKGESESYKSIFTESEIAEMDITGFEKVEVTE